MTTSSGYVVRINYFKRETGKYYASGAYITERTKLGHIFDEIGERFKDGRCPGLTGKLEFYAVADVPEHPHNHPKMFFPEA